MLPDLFRMRDRKPRKHQLQLACMLWFKAVERSEPVEELESGLVRPSRERVWLAIYRQIEWAWYTLIFCHTTRSHRHGTLWLDVSCQLANRPGK